GMYGLGQLPDMYNLVVNSNHELSRRILQTEDPQQRESQVKQALDLARLSQNLLKGEELTNFVKRSFSMMQ
ncbi:MAG TPA: molecular chaperone HtpG, partial [Chitinophagaceae bacterium]|nr:molecular chaperone HtpG [Chitinophagaceae bacterium]